MAGCRDSTQKNHSQKSCDLIIVGGGSAVFSAAIKGTELDVSIVMINDGLIGGTCVNVGCVPSKTLIRAAEAHHRTQLLSWDQKPKQSALAARDTRGLIILIRDRATDRLVGGRILAPEGGELIMEISLAIKCGITTAELANMFHPYLTNAEAIKLAALTFRKNVDQLSCCTV